MGTRDARIDAYIVAQKEFAQPILIHLREMVHSACPDVVETMKWSRPHFDYKGQMLCAMAAFKEHAAFGFWKASLIEGLDAKGGESAGSVGRLTTVKDLPSKKQLTAFIKAAMKLNDEGVTPARPKRAAAAAKPVVVPEALVAALAKNKKAKVAFEAFSPSHRREYCEWIAEAKREETRAKRVAQTVEWLVEGKARNWKYGA
jgi:uncharacterized protein YdeI (YjbR/CyaY-like superfamily)